MNKRFKWFGSLSNLSIRRSSDKTKLNSTSKHDVNVDATAVNDHSVDDMEGFLHSHGYARSCDMYTHVGTVPRKERHKSTKGSKKKGSSNAEMSGGQSQCQAGDYVRDSPLLSALSSASLPCLDRPLPVPVPTRPLPASLMPTCSPSLTSDKLASNRSCIEDPRTTSLVSLRSHNAPLRFEDPLEANIDLDKPIEMVAVAIRPTTASTALTQDVYVVMDPVAEMAHSHAEDQTGRHKHLMGTQETAKSPRDSQEVETFDSQLDSMDSSGEYVKFSKERFWLEAPSEKLRKELEEELKLSGGNLRSHAWYYGCIPWEVSETMVVKHGDFLIRDSLSSKGDYVLTSHWNNQTLHFLISKTLVQSSETYTRVQYTLEGEAFDSVPALVHFYVGNKTALTQQSGAQIHRPINRTLPLRYLETAFSLAGSQGCVVSSPSCQRGLKKRSGHGAETVCPLSPSTLHHREAAWNCGLSLEHSQPLSPIGEAPPRTLYNTTPQSRSPCRSRVPSVAPSPSLSRRTSGAQPCPSPNNTLDAQWSNGALPPLNQDHLSTDTETSSYTELYPGPPPQSYVDRLCVEEGLGVDNLKVENGNVYFSPVVETVSAFRPSSYQSQLMPKENKPLEVAILRRVKEVLAEVDPKTTAKHITKADCLVARILEVSPDVQRRMGVSSGMELLTLPHGHQLRLDLLERFQTMSIMLAVDVLGCTGTTEERATLLHKTIQIAAELKSNLGNMFGFAAIMRALELPQVSRLEQTWTVLRQRHTEGAILYEKTLKPFMKSLNDGKESCPLSNTSFPHIVPLLSLLEKSAAVGEGAEPWETVEAGMDVVMCHLGAARTIAQLGGVYRSNVETKLQGFQERSEVLELFLTEFQMRLLWGSRGAVENQVLRYAKFDQVLTALSNKLEPPVRPH